MATFAYVARDDSGTRVAGRLAAASRGAALSDLATRRLAPIEVTEVKERTGGRIPGRALAGAYRQLADLLRAGVPLLRALRLLARGKSNPRLARTMGAIADLVAEGEPLADAMSVQDGAFPDVHVAMVRAGERGGFLEQVLARLGAFLEHQADLKGRVVGNLLYPCVLLVLGVGVVVFSLLVLVPKFETFYAKMELGLPTKILLGASNLLQDRWPLVLGAIVVAAVGIRLALRREDVQRGVARVQMRVPVLGPLVRDLAVGRFARILGTLLENGIPLLPAMQVARDAAGHVLLADAIGDATEAVRAGEPLAPPLAASGLLSEDAVEVIAVGEQANNLPDVLVTLAETNERRVDRLLANLLRLLEPLLLLLMGGMVFFIFLALVVPMLQMSSAI